MLNREVGQPIEYYPYHWRWGGSGNPINIPVRYPMKWGDPGNPISQEPGGVTIPTSVLVGVIFFGLGMLLGPSLVASTDEGKKWLEKQARRIG